MTENRNKLGDSTLTRIDDGISLCHYFWESATHSPERPALYVDGREYTYHELKTQALAVAATLDKVNATQCVAVLAHRCMASYAGILGILASGRTYVPLNPKSPAIRNRTILELASVDVAICDPLAGEEFAQQIAEQEVPCRVYGLANPDTDVAGSLERVEMPSASDTALDDYPRRVDPSDTAYLMFTSGTTGIPKGVPISHRNASHYMDAMMEQFDFGHDDRFSQTFDLTFDLSVHDLFLSWGSAACLCVLPTNSLVAPAKFMRDQRLTVWFSVPSMIGFMHRFKQLTTNAFPHLRHSLFCGEALPVESAARWQSAAPQSTVVNLYGPTEATIAFTIYAWSGHEGDTRLASGLVPIGTPFPNLEVAVLGDEDKIAAPDDAGELLLGGPQVFDGYLNDQDQTARAFIELSLPERQANRWYRTGDSAVVDSNGELHFLGRLDNQVKINGHRVELAEIEHVIRAVAESDLVVAVPWPLSDTGPSGICAFICGGQASADEVIEACTNALPPYMVPHSIHEVDQLPLNSNGKVDRRKLRETLEANTDE